VNEPVAVLYGWNEVPQEALTALIARRIITGERMMISQLELEQGAVVPTHAHDNEQITYVLSGRMRFWLGSDESQGGRDRSRRGPCDPRRPSPPRAGARADA
jgi:mannose-6-phosphate isomerase-like protein (cupin superfamily)